MGTSDPLKIDRGWVRYLGILTVFGLATLLFVWYVLPSRPAAIVGGLLLLFVTIAGGRFIFDGPQPVKPKGEGRGSVDARAGIIEVFSTETGKIYINGKDMGWVRPRQTRQFLEQPVGSHWVEIVASKKRETKEMIVESGKIAYISFGLKSPFGGAGESMGKLVIESREMASGNVYIDNYKVGVLPENGRLEIVNLAVGTHQYRIERGTQSAMGAVDIRAGESTWIAPELPSPSNIRVIQ